MSELSSSYRLGSSFALARETFQPASHLQDVGALMKRRLTAVLFLPMGLLFGSRAEAQSNHLRSSTSAYLQRASSQPVDWYPWGAEAWARARQLDRPMLVDVGAVWCSLCHAMDRESYTVPATSAFINANFVAVKVDYDAQRQLAKQLYTAAAAANLPIGLPLTAFITADGKLYYGGTYFPAQPKEGIPGFKQTMGKALRMYRQQHALIERTGAQVKIGG